MKLETGKLKMIKHTELFKKTNETYLSNYRSYVNSLSVFIHVAIVQIQFEITYNNVSRLPAPFDATWFRCFDQTFSKNEESNMMKKKNA